MGEKWASNVSKDIIVRVETFKDGSVLLDVFDMDGKKEMVFQNVEEFEIFRNSINKLHLEVKKHHKK